jgi:hypothetical protein
MKAKIAETFRWQKRMLGLTFEELPGLFVVNLNDIEKSISETINQWKSYTVVHKTDDVYSHTTYTRDLPCDEQLIRAGILDAVQGYA